MLPARPAYRGKQKIFTRSAAAALLLLKRSLILEGPHRSQARANSDPIQCFLKNALNVSSTYSIISGVNPG